MRHSISNPASKVQLAYLTGRTGLYQDGKDKGKPADPLYPDYLNTHQEKMAYWKGVGDADNAYAAEQATRNEGADRARHHREFQASTHEGFIDNPRGRGNPFRTRATESGREAGGSPSSITTAGGRIPSQVAVLGVLTSVTIVDPNGKKDTVRPQLGGADVLLCTSASGKELYCLPKPANFQPIQQSLIGSAAGRKATEFHGAQVSKQATVSVSDTAIPRKQKLLGMVEGLVYEPMPGSPKANTQWTHEIGDTGGKKVGTKIALTSRMDGKGLYLTILKRSGPYPVTNDRGIVG
ncbi:MAG: hypothetical protein Q8R28_01250 [Dehalococcoidia bacterium]|nr:hypothetical protein [Dehalococcoidia bacterium]